MTNQQVSATTSFNNGFLIPNTSSLAYDPSQNNALQFIYDVTLHELGHVFGLDHPTNPDPGQSIMNGYTGTNDQGPHLDATGATVSGGTMASSLQPCDVQTINTANPPPPAIPVLLQPDLPLNQYVYQYELDALLTFCWSYSVWDDSTNSFTNYSGCS